MDDVSDDEFFDRLARSGYVYFYFNEQEANQARWLYRAVARGSLAECRRLCARLSPNVKQKFAQNNRSDKNPLFMAVKMNFVTNSLGVSRILLENGVANPNGVDSEGRSPLFFAIVKENVELIRLLVEHGADVNNNRPSPLLVAVRRNTPEVVRVLLQECGARVPSREHYYRLVDLAICHGNAQILSLLFQHGAFAGRRRQQQQDSNDHQRRQYLELRPSLNSLLGHTREETVNRDAKVAVCQVLVNHATAIGWEDGDAAELLQTSPDCAMSKEANNTICNESCRILLEAGLPATSRALYCAIRANKVSVFQLLMNHGADPLVEEHDCSDTMKKMKKKIDRASSPFQAAARREDTAILRVILELWNVRFSTTSGKNDNGLYPIQVLCRDKHVSLQAVQLLVPEEQEGPTTNRRVTTAAENSEQQARFPFGMAAMSDAKLDVIFYLLKQCPDALPTF